MGNTMNFKLGNFLTTAKGEEKTEVSLRGRRVLKLVLDGHVIFGINSQVPVIVANSKCIGLANIIEFTVGQYNTTVYFDLYTDINQESKRAYYKLYASSTSMNEGDDINSILPGATKMSFTPKYLENLDD
jgi:hypothetical protein